VNPTETAVASALQKKGLVVYRNGWPDFLIMDKLHRTGCALELKCGKDKLSPEQIAMHAALAAFGLPTYVIREDFLQTVHKRGRRINLPKTLETLKGQRQALEQNVRTMERHLEQLKADLEMATVMFDEVATLSAPRLPPHLEHETPIAPLATCTLHWQRVPVNGNEAS